MTHGANLCKRKKTSARQANLYLFISLMSYNLLVDSLTNTHPR